jgi:transglutaminase-like putative cysteine protease
VTRRARELEALLLPMFAAVPLYLTYAVGKLPLIVFHALMLAIAARVSAGKSPELIPLRVMRWLAIGYIVFYFVDWLGISHSAIAASTHLVLFIAVYQPIESIQRDNHPQRLLTASLIFVASVATSTHITIVLFVIAFAFLMFRQLMLISHSETVRSLGRPESPQGERTRTALWYVAGAALLGTLLFPFMPRVRNPIVRGFMGELPGSTTALSETIDFSEQRITPGDATVVARVWMDRATAPFFSPVRLRGNVYDYYAGGEWRQTMRGLRPIRGEEGTFFIARPQGITRRATIQVRASKGKLFLPVGTYAVSGLSTLYEGGGRDSFFSYDRGLLNFEVQMATNAEPQRVRRISANNGYPITAEVAALARRIVGNERNPERQAELIERWMIQNFRYVVNPNTQRPMTIEQFLLRDRAGHCEYFAAGMVVLLTSLDTPARIAGGFYGGRLNPLTGYFTLRREDAHAWTEVWNGARWVTFDSTPPALRPGAETTAALRAYVAALADSVTYFWDRYILTFGLGDQVELFSQVMTRTRDAFGGLRGMLARDVRGLASPLFITLLAVLLAAGLVSALTLRRRRSLFDLVAARLTALGVDVDEATTVEEALRALAARDAHAAAELAPLVALYEAEEFSGRPDRARRKSLRRALLAQRA